MKKNIYSLLLMAVALFSAVTLVSCGSEDDPIPEPPTPEAPKMGSYSLYFPSLYISGWPDSESGVMEEYEAYTKKIKDALKVDTEKKYLLSDLLAEKDSLQKVFDSLDDFNYTVKSCRNYYVGSQDIRFRVYEEHDDTHPVIDYGTKHVKSTLDLPEGSQRQLFLEIESYDKAVPSAKDYLNKVRELYLDALKDVFSEGYGTDDKSHQNYTTYTSIANCGDNFKEVFANMKKSCDAVEIPALPENIKSDAQAVTSGAGSKLSRIFNITITSFDITKTYPNRADTLEFENYINVK